MPSDNNILGLRALILDNFAVTMPTELKPKIVMAHNDNAWWVIIYGNDDKPIWKTNKGTDTPELALRKMLQSSSDLVFVKFKSGDDDIEENSDSMRARTVAEALPTGLNPPHCDSTLSSGFGSLESIPAANSLPSFSESWRTSSFGRPTVNAPVTQPSLFGTFASGLSDYVPSVNRFGDGTSSRVSGDVQTIPSRPFATFGSMPSFSSAAGSNYTGFGGLPTPKASTDTRSEEKPVNLDRTREVFGNPATYSSGFGGGFGSSVPSSSIKDSTAHGSPFAQPSASGDFGSSAGNGPFDRYTAKHNDTKRLSSSDEEWEVESDL